MDIETLLPILIPIIFFIIFPLFWSGIVFFISLLGGWREMAETHPYREPLAEKCFRLQSAILRFSSNYNGALNICADNEGLYFSVMFLFRPGHPPFFVPWEEISGTKKSHFFYQIVDLRFDRTSDLPFRIYVRTADKLVEASNGRWSYKEKQ